MSPLPSRRGPSSYPSPAAGNSRILCQTAISNRGRPNPVHTQSNPAPATAAAAAGGGGPPPTRNPTPESPNPPRSKKAAISASSSSSSSNKNRVRDSSQPPPPPETLASRSSVKIMDQVEAVILLDPRGVCDGIIAQGSRGTADSATHDLFTGAFASADTSTLLPGAKFGFQLRGATLVLQVLHTSRLEMPDQWGPRPIQFSVELLCADRQLVLFRLSSTDIRSPTEFFVYGFPFGNGASATIVKLPDVAPEIWASQSFGLVRHRSDRDNYVVSNLQRKCNPKTGVVEVFLHRWWRSGSSWQAELNAEVTLPSSGNVHMGKWQTDQVITFPNPFSEKFDHLLWVDLSQRCIICCNNPLQKIKANFNFIWLPYKTWVPRPHTFRSVGCWNGELKLVNIEIRDADTVYFTIMTFNKRKGSWNKATRFPLKCTELLAAIKNLPASPVPSDWEEVSGYHMPCFPLLSTYKDNILYVIIARKDNAGAWLLKVKVNAESWHLEGAAAYPGFSNHQKLPYSNCF